MIVQFGAVGISGLLRGGKAQRTTGCMVFHDRTYGIAPGIGGTVPGAVAHQAPVEELRARVVAVAVGIKEIGQAKLAGANGYVPGRGISPELVEIVFVEL